MWTGAKSIELGLADSFGSVEYVAREVIKAEDIRDYTQRANLAERFARQFGTDMAEGVMNVFGKASLK
jgi:protease-4